MASAALTGQTESSGPAFLMFVHDRTNREFGTGLLDRDRANREFRKGLLEWDSANRELRNGLFDRDRAVNSEAVLATVTGRAENS